MNYRIDLIRHGVAFSMDIRAKSEAEVRAIVTEATMLHDEPGDTTQILRIYEQDPIFNPPDAE